MKKSVTILALLLTFLSIHQHSNAQSSELIGGNILNGAVTGTILGTATMGLNNSANFKSLRVGLGAGILGGAGLAIYDVATLPKGQQFFVSGVFNDGTNSSVIILLDTVYGAGLGAALGSAVILISNKSLLDGLQYGTSAGAWAGFGFGLIDSFILSERNRDFIGSRFSQKSALIEISKGNKEFEFLSPDIVSQLSFSQNHLGLDIQPAVKLFSFNTSF